MTNQPLLDCCKGGLLFFSEHGLGERLGSDGAILTWRGNFWKRIQKHGEHEQETFIVLSIRAVSIS